LVALLATVVILGSAHLGPYDSPELDPRPALLPIYLLRSLARLAVAYAFAVGLALVTGHLAARSRLARRLILPTLDVLQSVPILGFFPLAVNFFISLSGGSALGVETAAVFLIFTSMFWNMAFGVYQSLITVPDEISVAAEQLGVRGPLRWSRLILPAVLPTLIYNSMVSWANGFYFLIASEIIAVGPARYTLPGLGSYLAQAVSVGRNEQALLAIVVLGATVVAMHLLVWGPLQIWAERFQLEEIGDHPRTPRIGRVLGRSRIVRAATNNVVVPMGQQALVASGRLLDIAGRTSAWGAAVLLVALLAVAGEVAARVYLLFSERTMSREIAGLPVDVLLSMARVCIGIAISAALAIPLAYAISRSRRARRISVPVIQMLASVPATAFFPMIVVLLQRGLGMNAAAVLLALTTMFWYVLFNVLRGALAIPKELSEAAKAVGLRGARLLRRLFVPAVLPSLVTGCVTAWGAGWNAMILCEYLEAGGRRYSVRGIGATLDHATYVTGDMQVIVASLVVMVLLIITVNRVFWDPVYQRVAARYKMEI
jgi:NitT/TauT family transport system permease protein